MKEDRIMEIMELLGRYGVDVSYSVVNGNRKDRFYLMDIKGDNFQARFKEYSLQCVMHDVYRFLLGCRIVMGVPELKGKLMDLFWGGSEKGAKDHPFFDNEAIK